jgi:hypothetical protein
MKKDSKKMTNKAGGILKKIALVFLCIILFILLLLGAITTFVSSDLAKNEVEQLAKNYVNGDVKIGDIDFDFYSSFPYLSLQLDSVDIRSNVVSIPSDSLCFVSSDWMRTIASEYGMNIKVRRCDNDSSETLYILTK